MISGCTTASSACMHGTQRQHSCPHLLLLGSRLLLSQQPQIEVELLCWHTASRPALAPHFAPTCGTVLCHESDTSNLDLLSGGTCMGQLVCDGSSSSSSSSSSSRTIKVSAGAELNMAGIMFVLAGSNCHQQET
jgi:hypothetical protein